MAGIDPVLRACLEENIVEKGMTNPNDPVGPCTEAHIPGISLTKRELFSVLAMQELIGMERISWGTPQENVRRVAEASCNLADALITELNEEPK